MRRQEVVGDGREELGFEEIVVDEVVEEALFGTRWKGLVRQVRNLNNDHCF